MHAIDAWILSERATANARVAKQLKMIRDSAKQGATKIFLTANNIAEDQAKILASPRYGYKVEEVFLTDKSHLTGYWIDWGH